MRQTTESTLKTAARIAALAALAMVTATASAQRGAKHVTFKVQCPGESINKALNKAPDKGHVTIEVIGVCHENVTIQRDNVTLLGTNPTSSKIIGVPEVNLIDESPVTVRTSSNVDIKNLTIAGGTSSGIATVASEVHASNCILEDNGFNGVAQTGGGLLRVDNCTIRNNTLSGVRVQDGGFLEVTNSSIESNGQYGVGVNGGARVLVGKNLLGEAGPTTITGNAAGAVLANDNGTADIANSTLESDGPTAVTAVRSASVILTNTSVEATGNFACAAFIGDGSVLRMHGGNTLSNDAPSFNCATLSVYRNSTVRIRGSGNTITNSNPVTGGPNSGNAGGFALDAEMVSSLRIDGTDAATINGNVESFNLSTVDLRKVVVNGGVYADGLTTNVRLRGNATNDVIVNGDVFPGGDSAVNIRNNGEVIINGDIDCSNGANVLRNFAFFGVGGGYVNCPFPP